MSDPVPDPSDHIPNVRDRIDELSRISGFGSVYGSMSDLYRGIDHRSSGTAFQKNTDHMGLLLFTRPELNLSYNNVLADRQLLPMLSQETLSQARAIRALLDPRGRYPSNLIDPLSAFIPILTNTALSASGFPDLTLNTYTSPEGIRKEAWSMVDDVAEINNTYDITVNFANVEGDPITQIFQYWTRYMGNVYVGDMMPYFEQIVDNRIDYETRIWRLIPDRSRRIIRKIGCANFAYPLASPLGASFNYSRDQAHIEENNQISIPFRCTGAEYNDPLLYVEFNQTVQMFNPNMQDGRRENVYHKLTHKELDAFNFRGYPRIDLNTFELEWWVSMEEFENLYRSNR